MGGRYAISELVSTGSGEFSTGAHSTIDSAIKKMYINTN